MALLAQTAILPAAAVPDEREGGGGETKPRPEPLLVPRKAGVAFTPNSGALVAALEDVIPGLLPAGFKKDQAALSTLGVRGIGLGDVVEAVAGLDPPPAWWSALYTALDAVSGDDPLAFDALAALPVPLADGRTVRGPARHAASGREASTTPPWPRSPRSACESSTRTRSARAPACWSASARSRPSRG